MSDSPSILITRELTVDQQSLADELGLRVVTEPAIRIDFRSDWLTVQAAVENTHPAIFAFTSQNGVKAFEQFRQAGVEFPDNVPVYAVGGKTEELLSEIGFKNVISPQQQNGVGLAHKIIDDILKNPGLKNGTVLHFCGDKRRDELRHYLTDSDISIKDIVVYSTKLNRMKLPEEPFDGILFYSPSSVQAFRQSGGFQKNKKLPELFAIGPTTAEELSIESGKHVHISPQPDTEIFLKFVARVLGETGNKSVEESPPSKGAMGDERNLCYNKKLKTHARNLRNDSTKSEIRLWTKLLRGKQTEYTFLRQRPVLNYIADFLCKDLKLIIELDGFSHEFEQQWKRDKKKQKELEDAGFKILRFSDDEVINDLRNVESEIMHWIDRLEEKSPPSKGETSRARGG